MGTGMMNRLLVLKLCSVVGTEIVKSETLGVLK